MSDGVPTSDMEVAGTFFAPSALTKFVAFAPEAVLVPSALTAEVAPSMVVNVNVRLTFAPLAE